MSDEIENEIAALVQERIDVDIAEAALRRRQDLSDERRRELHLALAVDHIAAGIQILRLRGPVH